MTFAAAVLLYAIYEAAAYLIARRQGYWGSWPVLSSLLGAWAVYELVG